MFAGPIKYYRLVEEHFEQLERVWEERYQAKDGNSSKTFLDLDWLAQLATHISNKGKQLVRYGY